MHGDLSRADKETRRFGMEASVELSIMSAIRQDVTIYIQLALNHLNHNINSTHQTNNPWHSKSTLFIQRQIYYLTGHTMLSRSHIMVSITPRRRCRQRH